MPAVIIIYLCYESLRPLPAHRGVCIDLIAKDNGIFVW